MRSRSSRSVRFPPQRKGAARQTESLGSEVLQRRLPGVGWDAPEEHPASLNSLDLLLDPCAAEKPLVEVPIGTLMARRVTVGCPRAGPAPLMAAMG